MGNKTTSESNIASPATQQVVKENLEKKTERPISYVVVRDGHRVSEREYLLPTDSAAIIEKEFWEKIANTHSHGEPVVIVQYDQKKHRIWSSYERV
jgi:hypothetical protein